MQHYIFEIQIDLLFLKGSLARREALKVLVPVLQNGRADPRQQLIVLSEAALPGPLRDDTLVHSVLLYAILEQLRVLALRLQLHLFPIVHLGLVLVGLSSCC